jgi:ribosomal protein L24E
MVQKMEGRFETDAQLFLMKAKYLSKPPRHYLWIGFNHSQVISGNGERYVLRDFDQKNDTTITTWEKGKVNRLYFRYQVNPRGMRWFSKLTFGLNSVQEAWGSDFTFNSVFSELKFWLPKNDEGLFLRFYGGKVFKSENAPIQDLLFLDGANPRQRFNRFYLRSNGSLPAGLHYQLPGGGNLRGYYNNPIYGDQIISINMELRKKMQIPFVDKYLNSLIGTSTVVAFFDGATMEFLDSTHETFADAGFGIRFQKFLPDDWYTIFTGGRNLTLRLDFPVWVSDPLPDENNVRFRWVFGFEQAF